MAAAFQNNFVKLIKYLRQQKALTQQELADKLSISLRTYQRLELSEAYPSVDVLINISKILGFKISEVFNYEIEATKEHVVLDTLTDLLEEATRIAHVGAWELDLLNNKVYWTQVTRDLHEVPEDFIPTYDNAILYYCNQDGSRNRIVEAVKNAQQFGRPFDINATISTHRGRKISVVVKGKPLFEQGTCVKMTGIFQDVTEYLVKEKTLKSALTELNFVLELGGFGKWELDLITNRLQWSKSLFTIFEIDPEKFSATYDAFLNMVHPEDREIVNNAYTESLALKKPYEVEHRLLMKDGRVKWIQEKCKTDFADDGRPIKSVGYALDITKYRNPENFAKFNWLS